MSIPSPFKATFTVWRARLPVTSMFAAENVAWGVFRPVAAIDTVTGRAASATSRPGGSGGATIALPSTDAIATSFPHTRLLPCKSTSAPRSLRLQLHRTARTQRTAHDLRQSRDER